MRKCAVCGSSFERYAGLDPVYIENPKKYGRKIKVKSELLNPEEYSCPVCYSADRDRMIVLFIKNAQRIINHNGMRAIRKARKKRLKRR